MNPPTLTDLNNDRKEGFRPTVVCCCLNDRSVLLLLKKEFGIWAFPQGGIKNKESPEEAILGELTEEMGVEFVNNCESELTFFGADQVEFLPEKFNVDELKTDDGQDVVMKGKKYYFYAIKCKKQDFDIKHTQFDDYFWLEYTGAARLCGKIHQKGRKRIVITALNLLKQHKLID